MRILIFDCETTGLPTERNASPLSTEKWPYIVQLSWILYDTNSHSILKTENDIIKIPSNINISKVSLSLHKITKEISQEKGKDIKIVLDKFNEQLKTVDNIVAHNLKFDKNMIMVECLRNKIPNKFSQNNTQKSEYCTMMNSIQLCKIIAHNTYGEEYFKYPKLSELYNYIFSNIPNGLHNSMIDVLLCLRCYGIITSGLDFYNESNDLKLMFEKYSII